MTPDTLVLIAVAMIAASLLTAAFIAAGASEPRVPVEAIRELEGYFDGCDDHGDGDVAHDARDDTRPARLRDRDGFLCEIPATPIMTPNRGGPHATRRHRIDRPR